MMTQNARMALHRSEPFDRDAARKSLREQIAARVVEAWIGDGVIHETSRADPAWETTAEVASWAVLDVLREQPFVRHLDQSDFAVGWRTVKVDDD
jgi:hypothetical protein